jgi:hypothetical protein
MISHIQDWLTSFGAESHFLAHCPDENSFSLKVVPFFALYKKIYVQHQKEHKGQDEHKLELRKDPEFRTAVYDGVS